MSLYEINNQLLRGKSLSDEKFSTEVLETLINIFQEAANFNEKVMHNSDSDLDYISADEMGVAAYITTVGMAKSIAKSVLENKLSLADENWRKNDLNDYKQSSKSSTIHMNNLKGLTEIMPFNQISELLTTLYYDLNTKFKALQSVASNRKFEIEKGLVEYTIRKRISN
jgi:hypothetical protein